MFRDLGSPHPKLNTPKLQPKVLTLFFRAPCYSDTVDDINPALPHNKESTIVPIV